MKKKGFTLLEMIGAIVIIGIIALLIIPSILGTLQSSKISLNETQLEYILDAAKKWGVSNYYSLSETDPVFIMIDDLASGGFIESAEIADLTNPAKNFDGCVMAMFSYKRQTYEYKYLEPCNPEDYENKVYVTHNYTSGWVKNVTISVRTEFKATDGETYFKYCSSSSPTCTPNKEVRKSSGDVTISTQSKNTYACAVSIADTGSQSDVVCVGPFKIDNTPPELTIPGNENLDSLVTTYDFNKGVSAKDNLVNESDITIERTGNISLGTLGSYTITYKATDLAGNEISKTRTVTVVDVTKPSIELAVTGSPFNSNGWSKTNLTVKATTSDLGGSGVKSYTYCVNSSKCTPSTKVTTLSQNITTNIESKTAYICAYSTDGAGNKSETSCIGPYKIDKTKPTMSYNNPITIGTSVKTYSLLTGVTFSDNYTLSTELDVDTTGNVSYGVSGTYNVTHSVTDLAGNNTTETRKLVIVDDEKPEISLTLSGSPFNSNGWATANFDIKVSTSDEGDGIASYTYCINTSKCTPSKTVNNTSGTHTISTESSTNYMCGYTTDKAGNKSETSCVGPYKLDKTKPTITYTNNKEISVTATSYDVTSDVTYKDNITSVDALTIGTPTNNIKFGTVGSYTVVYTATDAAGNKQTSTRTYKVIDDSKPKTTLTAAAVNGSNGWYKSNFNVTVNTSDIGEGVEKIYYCTNTSKCTPNTEATGTSKAVTVSSESKTNYVCAYSVDKAGNKSDTTCGGPYKLDKTGPTITYPAVTEVEQAEQTIDLWNNVTYSDNYTATASIEKSVTGTLNFAQPDDYKVTYTLKDEAGNVTTKERTITILLSTRTLTVTNQNNNYGTLSGNSSGTYNYGTRVTVTATPKQGYVFAGWMSNDKTVSSESTYSFIMKGENVTLKATYSFDITTISNINVLNVYPSVGNNLQGWMNDYGQGKITVTPVDIVDFNNNPTNYMGTSNNWKYDVIVFGFWDSNNDLDITTEVATLIRQFYDEGHSVIFGHDTLRPVGSSPVFSTVADLAGLTTDSSYPYWDGTGKNYGGTEVTIYKEGIFTSYPYNIGGIGTVLTIPLSHANHHRSYGDIWLQFNNETTNDPEGNFYLATYKNGAMIQTGHSMGTATEDEQKIIANLIFYMYSYDLMNR